MASQVKRESRAAAPKEEEVLKNTRENMSVGPSVCLNLREGYDLSSCPKRTTSNHDRAVIGVGLGGGDA